MGQKESVFNPGGWGMVWVCHPEFPFRVEKHGAFGHTDGPPLPRRQSHLCVREVGPAFLSSHHAIVLLGRIACDDVFGHHPR